MHLRIIAAGLMAFAVLPAACHRDLTLCRTEDEDPACRDAAAVDSAVTEADPSDVAVETAVDADIDAEASDVHVDTADAADSTPIAMDGAACETGSYECTTTGELRTCADGGSVSVVKCPSASTCDASLERCTVCTPGAFRCAGTARISCTSLGTESSVTCATPELCAASTDGSCKTAACSATDAMCAGKIAQKCNAGRTGFDSESCAIGCSGGTCLTVTALAAGFAEHFCALLSNGTVRCWGRNATGFAIPMAGPMVPVPVALADVSAVGQVAVARDRTAVRLTDGTVRASGGGAAGLGTAIPGISGATDLAVGTNHGCWAAGGTVRCWGDGSFGKLANGGSATETPPTFSSPSIVVTGPLALGEENSFAILSGGGTGWGLNDVGQLGLGDTTNRSVPTATFAGALQISAGLAATCARTATGVRCAGVNGIGQLGNGTTTASSSPVSVTGVGATLDIAVGFEHACALRADRSVVCWGANTAGQLGNGSTTNSPTPVVVFGVTAKDIAAAGDASCALLTDGVTVKCWGHRDLLGNSAPASSSTPVTVAW